MYLMLVSSIFYNINHLHFGNAVCMFTQGRDRRREESEQLTQLSNHNQKLVEQLAEVTCFESVRSQWSKNRTELVDV